MALPEAARKQLEEAEKLHQEVYGAEGAEPPAGKEKTDETAAPKDTPTLSEVPAAPGTPEEPAATEPPAETPEDAVDWQHKYKVLQGKYNAEVPRLQGEVNDMKAQMQELMASLNTPPEEIQPGAHLKPDEIEDYGEDMISVVKRAAREELEPEFAKLQSENSQLRGLLGGMQQTTARTARDQMIQELDDQLPTWREVNVDQGFLSWLANVDPYTGQEKLGLLQQAFENNNTTRVLAFFKGYLNENATINPQPTPGNPADPQVNLETLVAPGKAAEGQDVSAQETAPQGQRWKESEIKAFYADVNRGVYRTRPDEKERYERDIFLAQNEGRIAFGE